MDHEMTQAIAAPSPMPVDAVLFAMPSLSPDCVRHSLRSPFKRSQRLCDASSSSPRSTPIHEPDISQGVSAEEAG